MPLAKPGQRFDLQIGKDGKYILTRLEPVRGTSPARVRIEKRGRYSVGVLDTPIIEAALKEPLAKFP